jgi:hypothetical protein
MATKTIKYHPEVDLLEHEDETAPETKRVLLYGWDATNLSKVRMAVNASGETVSGFYGVNDLETAGAVTYVGKENSSAAWLMMKLDQTSGLDITYASIKNNATKTTYSAAWTDRAALTYGDYSAAT